MLLFIDNIFRFTQAVEQPVSRYHLRERRAQPGRWRNMKVSIDDHKRLFGLKMTIRQGVEKLGMEAVKSVVKEMMQLYSMDTFEGVNMEDMSTEDIGKIISSSTFLKDKYTAEGVFEKLKARLVAGGHLQDRNIYDKSTSPTVSTTSLFVIASIAAAEGRAVATVDFPGAFLNSRMPEDEPPVFMRLNKYESMVLTKIDKEFEKYLRPNGTIIVRLKRALYGCVQSARLWHRKLSEDLKTLGYNVNMQDMCVFNRTEGDGRQSTIVVHVDDLMITASTENMINKIIADIETIYKNGISVHRGSRLDYLGMTFDFSRRGKCKVTMDGYTEDLLTFCEKIVGETKTPAAENLFKVDDKSELLDKEEKEFFHSVTAKLLYLGKRVRPDILTAIAFLTKRVQQPTQQDMQKLQRVIKYVRATKTYGSVLEAERNLAVYAYVDASYGVHADMKSHTGVIIGIGKNQCIRRVQRRNLTLSRHAKQSLLD